MTKGIKNQHLVRTIWYVWMVVMTRNNMMKMTAAAMDG